MVPPCFAALSSEAIASLASVITRSGFDEHFLGRAEAIAPRMLDPVRLPVVHAWLRAQAGDAAIMARVFAYADILDEASLRAALGVELLDALNAAGFFVREPEGWRSAIRIVPFGGVLVASDPMEADGDPVMGPGATTQELLTAMPIPLGGRVLDVGCGAGSLALCAAKAGAAEITGVDLHPRAVEVARFNATLNGVDLRLATGDLTAPVAGREFDLVVAQPPFVVQPADVAATTYLHGGPRGDELTMRLFAELPSILAIGGRALVLFDSLDEPPVATHRIAAALGSALLRVIVIATPGLDAERLAIGYAAINHPKLDARYAAAARAYAEHMRRLGATRTHHLLVDIRHDPALLRAFAVPIARASLQGHDAHTLLETEAAIDLALDGDDALLEARLVVSPGAWIEQAQSLTSGETLLRVRFDDPGRAPQVLSDAAAFVVEALREGNTGHEVVSAYAEAAEAEPGEIRDSILQFLRTALASGLIARAR